MGAHRSTTSSPLGAYGEEGRLRRLCTRAHGPRLARSYFRGHGVWLESVSAAESFSGPLAASCHARRLRSSCSVAAADGVGSPSHSMSSPGAVEPTNSALTCGSSAEAQERNNERETRQRDGGRGWMGGQKRLRNEALDEPQLQGGGSGVGTRGRQREAAAQNVERTHLDDLHLTPQ